ncbi:SH3 domain-containing protein [Flavobacterium sp.]|uniref:SH3 domain-containing protein n=1 Tax=Flavobacterium sp. TaxID=239 RepID=UPI0025BC4C99|nr:SH3 domain-containing protein [Flavobacterium sp.]
MMKVFKILETYKTQYENPVTLHTGEIVKLGEEEKEEKWKGWIWAENEVNKGWVPLQILEISLNKKEAKVLEYYTAKELNVDEDDEIVKIKSLNGWTWVRKIVNNAEGWIPDEIIG